MLKQAKTTATAAASLVKGGCTAGVTGGARRVLPPAAQLWDPCRRGAAGEGADPFAREPSSILLREGFCKDCSEGCRWLGPCQVVSGPAGNHGNTRGVSGLGGEHDGALVAWGAFGGPWGESGGFLWKPGNTGWTGLRPAGRGEGTPTPAPSLPTGPRGMR